MKVVELRLRLCPDIIKKTFVKNTIILNITHYNNKLRFNVLNLPKTFE